MLPWAIKYLPKSLNEVQGQNKAVESMYNFIDIFPKIKSALLYGPPGSGKTSAIHALATEKNLELIEVNASDVRNAEAIKKRLGPAMTQMSLFG